MIYIKILAGFSGKYSNYINMHIKKQQHVYFKLEKDLDTLLKKRDVDCVVVFAPESMHKEVIVAATQAGKHINKIHPENLMVADNTLKFHK